MKVMGSLNDLAYWPFTLKPNWTELGWSCRVEGPARKRVDNTARFHLVSVYPINFFSYSLVCLFERHSFLTISPRMFVQYRLPLLLLPRDSKKFSFFSKNKKFFSRRMISAGKCQWSWSRPNWDSSLASRPSLSALQHPDPTSLFRQKSQNANTTSLKYPFVRRDPPIWNPPLARIKHTFTANWMINDEKLHKIFSIFYFHFENFSAKRKFSYSPQLCLHLNQLF